MSARTANSVHVIGANGRAGAALCRALLARGIPFVPIVRDAAKWAALALPGTPRLANAGDRAELMAASAMRAASFRSRTRAIPPISSRPRRRGAGSC